MKLFKILICVAALLTLIPTMAQTTIDPHDRFEPSDSVFMDIAVDMAQASLNKGGKPGGTAIILNGAFHSAGNGATPELAALQKAHAPSLVNAVVYTVNEPDNEAWIALSHRGVSHIFFVNSRNEVVASRIYTAADYDDSSLPSDLKMSPKTRVDYLSAAALIAR